MSALPQSLLLAVPGLLELPPRPRPLPTSAHSHRPRHAMHRPGSSRTFSVFRKPHEILAANLPSITFTHSRQRNRSSGGSSASSSSRHATPNLLVDDSDEDEGASTSRSRPIASRSNSRTRSDSPPYQDNLDPDSVPLRDWNDGRRDLLARTPSPYLRREEEFGEDGILGTGFHEGMIGAGSADNRGLASWFRNGKLGSWLWDTKEGWMVYIGLLLLLYGVCSLLLLIMNRFILWTGVYKFGYPLMTSFLELVVVQILLYFTASISRSFSRSLHALGFGNIVAPKPTPSKGKRRGSGGLHDLAQDAGRKTTGDVFEFKWEEVRQVLPLAVCFSLKIMSSNLSFAYTQIQIYQLSRVGTVFISLILTHFFYRTQSLSVTTLSSCITMMLSMAVVSLRPGTRFAIEGFIAGVVSTVFVAAYPMLLTQTYKRMLSGTSWHGVLTGDLIGSNAHNRVRLDGDGKDEARTGWKLLHYTNVLSMALVFPFVVFSGELRDISRNCYFLDVAFFWLMVIGAGAASWATFVIGFLLVRATTPLTVVVSSYPNSALQTVLLTGFRMPTWSWVGCLMCWGSSVWYFVGRVKECGVGSYTGEQDEQDERPGMA